MQLQGCKFSASEASELVDGFFIIGDTRQTGKVDYSEFLAELIRMQTFKVLRVVQFRLNELESKKKEFDPVPKISIDDFHQLVASTGLGDKVVAEQVTDCISVQVGNSVKNLSLKGVVRWYFGKYYPDSPGNKPSVEALAQANEKRHAHSKKVMEAVLASVTETAKQPGCKDKKSEAFHNLSFQCGKLMGLMELLENDLEKIFATEEQAQIQAAVEKCLGMGVQFS
mmetsp:Transcript_10837/g.20593  ORF Transcript_10837/g.20593 Transcript_10837/m.20593 type:complete len:226 (+) Transcript_10837:330-1007(+)